LDVASIGGSGRDACISVSYRFSGRRAVVCWQAWQVQVGSQLQTSPHWHEAGGTGAGFWQPQVH
jgi:hypothetical protein